MRALVRLAIVATVVACRGPAPMERTQASAVAVPASSIPAAERPPQDAGPEIDAAPAPVVRPSFETWRTGDFDVVASLPAGAPERRPVVVGVHGSHDRPEAACARWRRTLGAYPFVVCPAGVPYRGGLAWGSAGGVAERIDRALAALRERHGAYVADGPVVYAGWSLGATRGPEVVALRPGLFGAVILAEIGHTRIDANTSARSLRAGRAARTLVACATQRCATFAKRLERANGPAVTLVDAGIGRGHLFDDQTARAIGAAFVASDPHWNGLAAALAAGTGANEPLPPLDDEPDLAPSDAAEH